MNRTATQEVNVDYTRENIEWAQRRAALLDRLDREGAPEPEREGLVEMESAAERAARAVDASRDAVVERTMPRRLRRNF